MFAAEGFFLQILFVFAQRNDPVGQSALLSRKTDQMIFIGGADFTDGIAGGFSPEQAQHIYHDAGIAAAMNYLKENGKLEL